LILIGAGIYLLTLVKRINKPYFKWVAIIMIIIGVVLTLMEIIDLIKK